MEPWKVNGFWFLMLPTSWAKRPVVKKIYRHNIQAMILRVRIPGNGFVAVVILKQLSAHNFPIELTVALIE